MAKVSKTKKLEEENVALNMTVEDLVRSIENFKLVVERERKKSVKLQANLDKSSSDALKLRNELKHLKQQRDLDKKELQDLKNQNSELHQRNERLAIEHTMTKNQNDELSSALTKRDATILEYCENVQKHLDTDTTPKAKQIENLKKKNSELEAKVEGLLNQRQDFSNFMQTALLKGANAAPSVKKLTKENSSLSVELELLRSRVASMQEELDAAGSKIANAVSMNEDLQRDIDLQKELVKDLKHRNSKLQKRVNEFEDPQVLMDASVEIAQLKQELAIANIRNQALMKAQLSLNTSV